MLTLLKKFLHVLLWDENAARRWLYGLASFGAMVAANLLVFGIDTVLSWSDRELVHHAAVASLGLILTIRPFHAPPNARHVASYSSEVRTDLLPRFGPQLLLLSLPSIHF